MDGISKINNFIALHSPQLILSGVPKIFWPSIYKKITDKIFDAGLTFQLILIDYEETEKSPYDPVWTLLTLRDIDCLDASHIYLIDHAWTFKANSVKSNLRNVPGLLERLCYSMQISAETVEDKIDKVSEHIWKYAQTYAIAGDDVPIEDRMPVWYVLDELGSAIIHSDTPNFRAVPFIYVPEQMAYTLLFPIKDVEEGGIITRNFVEGQFSDPIQREAMLIPWKHYEHYNEDYTQQEPSSKYFLEGHLEETLPQLDMLKDRENSVLKLKVFSEYRYINEYLTSPDFEIVHTESEADILWYVTHFKEYEKLSVNSPHKFINQFPFEYVITVKDLLAIVSRRASDKYNNDGDSLQTGPRWLPTTFNMKTEFVKLVAYYMKRKNAGLDNHWICKPFNLARGLDTHITNNIDFLCRLPLTGPKIAQKYIDDPVLFERQDVGKVKFDIRYVILLNSVHPVQVFTYNNFFLRFANKQFSLDNFDEYEKHFTVMNYNEDAPLFKMLCTDFKEEWSRQYANYDWEEVEKSIFKMLSELFTAATAIDAPRGIAQNPQSRALYAADIMLSWQKSKNEMVIQPILLEINWMPDCRRACEYYPNFYNDIFSVMFLNKEVETCTKIM